MNYKQLDSTNNIRPADHSSYGKSSRLQKLDMSTSLVDKDEVLDDTWVSRLNEMEKLKTDLEELLEQRTKELNDVVEANAKFISILAHDLRSPFSSILGVLEILKESLDEYNINEIEKYVNMAADSANKTLNLLDNLLAWAISQNKEKSFNPVKINLRELLGNEIESIFLLAKQKQIELNLSVDPDLNVIADLQMAKTILRNLITNAIKYTGNNGEINLSASENKQYVEIVIEDNGIGISFETQRDLFKIDGFRSTVGTNNEHGTGLGLKLSREFVEMHGGKIWIESEPGVGSRFIFTLPHYI